MKNTLLINIINLQKFPLQTDAWTGRNPLLKLRSGIFNCLQNDADPSVAVTRITETVRKTATALHAAFGNEAGSITIFR